MMEECDTTDDSSLPLHCPVLDCAFEFNGKSMLVISFHMLHHENTIPRYNAVKEAVDTNNYSVLIGLSRLEFEMYTLEGSTFLIRHLRKAYRKAVQAHRDTMSTESTECDSSSASTSNSVFQQIRRRAMMRDDAFQNIIYRHDAFVANDDDDDVVYVGVTSPWQLPPKLPPASIECVEQDVGSSDELITTAGENASVVVVDGEESSSTVVTTSTVAASNNNTSDSDSDWSVEYGEPRVEALCMVNVEKKRGRPPSKCTSSVSKPSKYQPVDACHVSISQDSNIPNNKSSKRTSSLLKSSKARPVDACHVSTSQDSNIPNNTSKRTSSVLKSSNARPVDACHVSSSQDSNIPNNKSSKRTSSVLKSSNARPVDACHVSSSQDSNIPNNKSSKRTLSVLKSSEARPVDACHVSTSQDSNIPNNKSSKRMSSVLKSSKARPVDACHVSTSADVSINGLVPSDGKFNQDERNDDGETMLHHACVMDDFDTVTACLKLNYEVNVTSYNNSTPLHEATRNGNFLLMQLLIDNGAWFHVPDFDTGSTPLHYAVRSGHPSTVEILLKNGCPTDFRNIYGQTALNLLDEGALRTIKYLDAIVAGIWVLDVRWLKACSDSQDLYCSEKEFELIGCSASGATHAPKRYRHNKNLMLPGLFYPCKFLLLGPFDEDLRKLISAAGGEIVNDVAPYAGEVKRPRPFHSATSSQVSKYNTFVVFQSNGTKDYEKAIKLENDVNLRIKAVSVRWVLECIAAFKFIPF